MADCLQDPEKGRNLEMISIIVAVVAIVNLVFVAMGWELELFRLMLELNHDPKDKENRRDC